MVSPGQRQRPNITTGPTKAILITQHMLVYIVGWTISEACKEEARWCHLDNGSSKHNHEANQGNINYKYMFVYIVAGLLVMLTKRRPNITYGPTKPNIITQHMFVHIVGRTISDAGKEEARWCHPDNGSSQT